MALVTADNLALKAQGFNSLPALRQLGLMIGLAVSVALGVTVALWSQTPNYSLLYGDLSAKNLSQVTKSLETAGIEYRIENGGGILVPADRLQDARMNLASNSLSPGGVTGFELLDKSQGLGSNSFILKAQYQRALEGELAKSISRLNVVDSARVHLAIPKRSAFARVNNKPAASVVLKLMPGWVIDEAQTAAIVNIVASSVAGMGAEQVTVVDDKGRLLSSKDGRNDMMMSSTQFDYTRKLEESYAQRIIDIISPMTGEEGVRAQVVADIDFTSVEETRESYQPDQSVVRSEQLFEQKTNQEGASGVPGALTNEPPPGGEVVAETENGQTATSLNNSSRTMRNYEVDKTISHKRTSPAALKRLSVAVVLDYRTSTSKKGKLTREALTEEEIQRATALIKEAVGLNEARGDTINVVNTPFQLPEKVKPLPEPPIWEQAWALTLARQVVGGLLVLFIALGILRPVLKSLAAHGEKAVEAGLAALPPGEQMQQLPPGADRLTLSNQQPVNGQQLKDMASSMVKEDPKRVAQVLNSWIEKDE